MKKFLSVLLCIICLLSLYACANVPDNPDTPGTDPDNPVTDPDDGKAEELTLKYDDRYVFEKDVKCLETISSASTNLKTGEPDCVLSFRNKGDSKTVVASGVGKALVVFEDGSTCTVTVEKATISVLMIFGQSNGEGWTKKEDASQYEKAISQSVICKEGQVYSTYAPSGVFSGIAVGRTIGGVNFASYLTADNYRDFVPESLTSDKSANGKTLDYKLNSLSENGQGKSGIDSALAYKWHEITGEKVWVINAAHGASDIASWQRGGANFSEATLLVKACERVLKAEIDAGHYVFSKMGYFWSQGCADVSMTCEEYTENFKKVHTELKAELACELNADMPGEEGISFAGLVMVRTPKTHVTEEDLVLGGPRASYLYMGASNDEELSDVWLASVAGDEFTSVSRVRAYFTQKYSDGKISLPLRTAYRLPTTVEECHPDIHYRQPGYNELGAEAAERILNVLQGTGAPEQATVSVYKEDGVGKYSDGDTVTLRRGKSLPFGIRLEGLPEYGKLITIEPENDDISVSYNSITVSSNATSETVKVKFLADGKVVMTLNVQIPAGLTADESGSELDVDFEDIVG